MTWITVRGWNGLPCTLDGGKPPPSTACRNAVCVSPPSPSPTKAMTEDISKVPHGHQAGPRRILVEKFWQKDFDFVKFGEEFC